MRRLALSVMVAALIAGTAHASEKIELPYSPSDLPGMEYVPDEGGRDVWRVAERPPRIRSFPPLPRPYVQVREPGCSPDPSFLVMDDTLGLFETKPRPPTFPMSSGRTPMLMLTPSAVPLPPSGLLLLVAAGGLMLRARRR